MLDLNLPQFEVKLKKQDKLYIWDQARCKYVALTPEEWVRQHFVNYLIVQLGYPSTLIANEVEIKLNGQKRRCDTLIYDRNLSHIVIIEYKAPTVPIDQHVVDQIVRYNMVLKVQYLIISNGLEHYCFELNYDTASYSYLKEIPSYEFIIK